ncbi:MAG: hypothetical protein A3A27_00535 [Candidatus Wildermuthbacteria bacterium RIFCSPLOWO2_01_FULL_47_18]|uniref:DEAD/DEAH box helicase n=1 Tax=Candidatus Wildermuthbacteria bacterium RIFCSPLOWO2_01_FULL_47_18 TaxID=1802460 RepID=A0A1G2RHG8_9BACT|nr:MAG: hypothetical protein A3A27_00535 [Candidatus Wildermuthbacteria bacterium RIFCSPLOWO2_01_FULL_47_18]OHB17090.1 MAG: hypothetical protein A2749_03130 [Parcubacteria group bacterium RIFCSPHIGHO2_01_FULL_45_26]
MAAQQESPAFSGTFSDLGIAPRILETLNRLGYRHPTPIQEKAIPTGIEGKDMMGIAQTGTGKTLAFGIPMLQRLASMSGMGLVVLPTRELALQVEEMLKKIGPGLGMRTAVLIGGTGMGPQISALRNKPSIIIATPGRLIDHLEHRSVRLDMVKILVLDEADRMLDMGFAPQLNKILSAIPRERQTMLFSATMPSEITKIATRFMRLPLRIEVAPAGTTVARVTQEIFIVGRHDKERLLEKLLGEYRGTTLVFTRTKWGAKKLMRAVKSMGHSTAELHGNRSLGQRKEALDGFKTGRYRVLVATDIASRGIDVVGINLVVNYDLPMDAGDYVHRIGRTARAGAGGHAISFATPEERRDLRDIERLINKTLPISKLPENLPPQRSRLQSEREPMRNFRGNNRFNQRRR